MVCIYQYYKEHTITPVEKEIPNPDKILPHASNCAIKIPNKLGTLLNHAHIRTHLFAP